MEKNPLDGGLHARESAWERGPHRGSRHHCPPACLSVDAEHVHGSSSTAPKKTRTNDATHPTIHVMNHDSIPPGSEREVTISSGGAVGDRTETGAEPWRRPARDRRPARRFW